MPVQVIVFPVAIMVLASYLMMAMLVAPLAMRATPEIPVFCGLLDKIDGLCEERAGSSASCRHRVEYWESGNVEPASEVFR
jgi:hypothetical protein